MKIIVIGSGFTGAMSAAAIKIHCPEHEVIMIDSDREPKNIGFGESAPPNMQQLLFDAFQIPEHKKSQWFGDFIMGTHSTIKYNFRWQNFLDTHDQGYYSGIGDMPSYEAIFEPTHSKKYLSERIVFPDHHEYKIHDLWYELYLQGRRDIKDFEADINPFYWYSRNRTWIAHASQFSCHLNSFHTAAWLKANYGDTLDRIIPATVVEIQANDQGGVTGLLLDNGQQITGDLYLDCSGFKRIFANRFGQKIRPVSTDIKHNACIVVANSYTKNIDEEMHPYTNGYGMQYGWTFSIPLVDRKSFGYVYDSKFISDDQALSELSDLSNPDSRVIDPIHLNWTPGCYAETWKNNYVMLGLASGFVDPFDANTIGVQFLQMNAILQYLKTPQASMDQAGQNYSIRTVEFFEKISERVEFHFGLAPRNTSDYWTRNHVIAQDKDLENKIFNIFASPDHSLANWSKLRGKPYMSQLYLSETIYYGIDMSRRCRRSDPRLLDFAEQYFKSFNELNRMRSELAPTMRQWYQQHNIDIDQYIKE